MRTLPHHELHRHPTPAACDRRLELAMRRIVLVGAALVLAVPAARGDSAWFGALPLWLLGMPLASWWALHHFRLPGWPRQAAVTGRRRRSGIAQARRRSTGNLRRDSAHANAA